MAMFNAQSGFTTDPETGCVRGYNDYEECRQNYFLKQQNQILRQQSDNSSTQQKNAELKSQAEQMQQEIEALKSQQVNPQEETQASNNLATSETAIGTFNPSLTYALIIVTTVIITLIVTKYLAKRN